jgi:hypothetical protein
VSFLKPPGNALLKKQLEVAVRLNGTRLQMHSISNAIFPGNYVPWLVQDVIAARLWLDVKHEAEELNSHNLILIAEGDGSTLATIWMMTEAKRHKVGTTGQPELRDLYGAVWLEPHHTLRGLNHLGSRQTMAAIQAEKAWPPMLTLYDRTGIGEKSAAAWAKAFKQDGKIGGEKGLALPQRGFTVEPTLLAADGAERAVTDYVSELLKGRPLRAWAKRDLEASTYVWDLGGNRRSVAKAAKATRPALAPLNNWGFTTLRIQ